MSWPSLRHWSSSKATAEARLDEEPLRERMPSIPMKAEMSEPSRLELIAA